MDRVVLTGNQTNLNRYVAHNLMMAPANATIQRSFAMKQQAMKMVTQFIGDETFVILMEIDQLYSKRELF